MTFARGGSRSQLYTVPYFHLTYQLNIYIQYTFKFKAAVCLNKKINLYQPQDQRHMVCIWTLGDLNTVVDAYEKKTLHKRATDVLLM